MLHFLPDILHFIQKAAHFTSAYGVRETETPCPNHRSPWTRAKFASFDPAAHFYYTETDNKAQTVCEPCAVPSLWLWWTLMDCECPASPHRQPHSSSSDRICAAYRSPRWSAHKASRDPRDPHSCHCGLLSVRLVFRSHKWACLGFGEGRPVHKSGRQARECLICWREKLLDFDKIFFQLLRGRGRIETLRAHSSYTNACKMDCDDHGSGRSTAISSQLSDWSRRMSFHSRSHNRRSAVGDRTSSHGIV